MGWPEYIYLALLMMGLGIAMAQDGKPKTGKHSFWASLVGVAIILLLLRWGGFFQ